MQEMKIYNVGKKWRDNKCVDSIGEYTVLQESIDSCPKGYKVFDETGKVVYSNDRNKKVFFLLMFFMILLVGGGIAFSYFVLNNYKEYIMPENTRVRYDVNSQLGGPNEFGFVTVPKGGGTIISPKCGTRKVDEGTIVRPDGILVIPIENSKLTVDEYGHIHVEFKATIVFLDCSEKIVGKDTIMVRGGTVVEPGGDKPLIVDEWGNVIVPDGEEAVVTLPSGECSETVPAKTMILPVGIVVIPLEEEKMTIDSYGNIHITHKAKIIFLDCSSRIVTKETIIVPGGTVVEPGDCNNPLRIDGFGNVIVEDCEATVTPPYGCTQKAISGSIILPDGRVIIPLASGKPYIDKFGYVHIIDRTKIVFPDCTEKIVKKGTIIIPGGPIIEPTCDKEPKIDSSGNIILEDCDAIITQPGGCTITVPKGSVITKSGLVIIPLEKGKLTVDEFGYIHTTNKARIIFPDCTEKIVKKGTVIVPEGPIIEPGDCPNPILIDEFGNITTNCEAIITQPGGCTVTAPKGSVVTPQGLIIITLENTKSRVDEFGNIHIQSKSKIIFPDCSEKIVKKGTIIVPGGPIIEPGDCGTPLKVDDYGNVHIEGCEGVVTSPGGCAVTAPVGSIVTPSGLTIIPLESAKPIIDQYGNIHLQSRSKIIFPDCTEKIVKKGTIIVPGGPIVEPGDCGTPLRIDQNGNIIIEGCEGVITYPEGCSYVAPVGSIVTPGGLTIIHLESAKPYVDKYGNIHLQSRSKIIFPDCSEKIVKKGTIITPDDIIVEPGDCGNPLTVDSYGNIIVENCEAVITPPGGCTVTAPVGSIVTSKGLIIVPLESAKPVIDKHGNIILQSRSKVIFPDCKERIVKKGSIVVPGGPIVEPGDCNTPLKVDDFGNVIIEDCDATIITTEPDKCIITAPPGSIVLPAGWVVVGSATESVSITSKGTIIIPKGGKIIFPDCTERYFPNGGWIRYPEIGEGECEFSDCKPTPPPPVCDSNIKCCSGNTYPTNPNCPKPEEIKNLSLLYTDGPELKITGVSPGTTLPTKTFSIKNTGDGEVNYNILWTKVINQFSRPQDVRVTIKRNGVTVANNIQAPTANGNMFTNIPIAKGDTHNYELVFRYVEAGVNQNIDQNKIFSTLIQVGS